MPRYLGSCTFRHDTLGVVHVCVRSNARRLSARWKNSEVHISAPHGVDEATFNSFLAQCCRELPIHKPTQLYTLPMTMHFNDFDIELQPAPTTRRKITADVAPQRLTIHIPENLDISSPQITRRISRVICTFARFIAPQTLLPLAHSEAQRIGRAPLAWQISTGHRTLGHCNTKGIIALSYVLMFLPTHLRRYVICHELAHLSEMNHSARFHSLVNNYCDGHEKQFIAELKSFRWPILK